MNPTLVRAFRLRCPRCGEGNLFRGLFRMHDACSACGASFTREQGFYLGSIYINYGVTVIGTGALYALLVLGLGWSHESALIACLVAAVAFPVWFFRWARSLLLALDGSVNRRQAAGEDAGGTESLAGDDARAGCAMGVALALILLFGLGMAVVTILFTVEAEGAEVVPTVGSIERLDPRFDELVPASATIEVLAMGFDWAEGPVWLPAAEDREACLLFSDVPRNRINRWRPGSLRGQAAQQSERRGRPLLRGDLLHRPALRPAEAVGRPAPRARLVRRLPSRHRRAARASLPNDDPPQRRRLLSRRADALRGAVRSTGPDLEGLHRSRRRHARRGADVL